MYIVFSGCATSLFLNSLTHGSKTGANFRLWKSTPIFEVDRFSTPETDMAANDGDDAVATTIFISVVVIENVIEIYLHKFCTIYKQAKQN